MADAEINVVGLANTPSKSKGNGKIIGAIIGIAVLVLGVVAGIYLVGQQQNIQEKAACVAACPDTDGTLRSCVGAAGSDTVDSVCNAGLTGRIEVCGQSSSTARQYCCSGGTWKTSLAACAVSTATATATATTVATATSTATTIATATATTRATATATATSVATGAPNSCGGTCGSNSNCASGLFCSNGFCRNASCSSDTDCICNSATTTPTKAPTTAPVVVTPTDVPVPVTGTSWPTILGAGFGIITILVSIMLAL